MKDTASSGSLAFALLLFLRWAAHPTLAQECPDALLFNTTCQMDDDTSIILETTGHPLLDSWRIFAADTKDLFNPIDDLPLAIGTTKEVGISIANQLAFRVDGFGERDRLLKEATKLYHNVYEVRTRYLNRGRHRIVYFATTSFCRGRPPCLETDLRPAIFAVNSSSVSSSDDSEGINSRILSWPSIREEEASDMETHVDSCFGRYGPEDFDLGVKLDYEVEAYVNDSNSDSTGLEDAHAKLVEAKEQGKDFSELFQIVADQFITGLDDAEWEGIDNGLRVYVDSVTLPDTLPPEALEAVPELKLETLGDVLQGGPDNAEKTFSSTIRKVLDKAISKRNDGEYTLLHFIEPKTHPAPPEAATDVNIVLSATAAVSGLIIEEILLGRAFLAGSGPGDPVIRRALTKMFRLGLVGGLFIVDTLPLVLLLASEVGVANYRGLHISGTVGASIYGVDKECPAGFPLGLGTHVTMISVSDARVALIASVLAAIMVVRVVMLTRKVFQRKDMFVATFKNTRMMVREAVVDRHVKNHYE